MKNRFLVMLISLLILMIINCLFIIKGENLNGLVSFILALIAVERAISLVRIAYILVKERRGLSGKK